MHSPKEGLPLEKKNAINMLDVTQKSSFRGEKKSQLPSPQKVVFQICSISSLYNITGEGSPNDRLMDTKC